MGRVLRRHHQTGGLMDEFFFYIFFCPGMGVRSTKCCFLVACKSNCQHSPSMGPKNDLVTLLRIAHRSRLETGISLIADSGPMERLCEIPSTVCLLVLAF